MLIWFGKFFIGVLVGSFLVQFYTMLSLKQISFKLKRIKRKANSVKTKTDVMLLFEELKKLNKESLNTFLNQEKHETMKILKTKYELLN